MKATDRITFVLAIITVAFLLIVSAFTAQAQSCVTPSDDAEYCLVPDATLTPFVPTATSTPTVAPTQQPTATVTVVILPWKRYVYLPIGAKP